MQHPLIQKTASGENLNSHYDKLDEPSIMKVEKKFTRKEIIAWCRINEIKYTVRMDFKGQKESDHNKRLTYMNYANFLQNLNLTDYEETLPMYEVYGRKGIKLEY